MLKYARQFYSCRLDVEVPVLYAGGGASERRRRRLALGLGGVACTAPAFDSEGWAQHRYFFSAHTPSFVPTHSLLRNLIQSTALYIPTGRRFASSARLLA